MINVALFGFGRIGQMHAENLNKNKEIKLLYVYEKINQLSFGSKMIFNCKKKSIKTKIDGHIIHSNRIKFTLISNLIKI